MGGRSRSCTEASHNAEAAMSKQSTFYRRIALVSLSALSLFFFAAVVQAQPKKAESPAKPAPAATDNKAEKPEATAKTEGATANAGDDQTKVKVERGAGGKKVYKIEGEIVIEGKIQKPEAFYVLQKSSINYDWHELKQEFVPKILDSVTKAPF
jgi:hypothetical protein